MNGKHKNTIEKRQNKEKESVLRNLRKTPIIQVACNQAAVSRATYYRWREEDKKFRKAVDEAINYGELLINDMSESQIITLIKEKNWQSIAFWLRHHHPKYANRIEVDAKIKDENEELTPKQKKIVEEALRLATLDSKQHGKEKEKN